MGHCCYGMLDLGPLPTQETVGGLLRADLPEADARHLIASPWIWIIHERCVYTAVCSV